MRLERQRSNWGTQIAACLLAGALLSACGDAPVGTPTAVPAPTAPPATPTTSKTIPTVPGFKPGDPLPGPPLPTMTSQQDLRLSEAALIWMDARSFHFVVDKSAIDGSVIEGDVAADDSWTTKTVLERLQFTTHYAAGQKPDSQLRWIPLKFWQKTGDQWQKLPSSAPEYQQITDVHENLSFFVQRIPAWIRFQELRQGPSAEINGQICDSFVGDGYQGQAYTSTKPFGFLVWIGRNSHNIVRTEMVGTDKYGVVTISKLNEPVTIDPPP